LIAAFTTMHRLRRLGLSAFAFCIALMQFGMPVLAYARMAQESSLGQFICSPYGAIKRVLTESDGTVRETGTSSGQLEHCALCSAGGAVLPHLRAAIADIIDGEAPLRHGDACLPYGNANLGPPATGPPPTP
jgi:hypothetical protein